MSMYPNGLYLTMTHRRVFGPGAGLEQYSRLVGGARMNRYINPSWSKKVGDYPSGYGIGGGAIVPAITHGGLSSWNGKAVTASTSGTAINGMTLTGPATFTLSTIGGASLIITLESDGTFTFSQTGLINMTTGLSGSGTWTLTTSGLLAMIVPFAGDSYFTLSATANLKGLADLAGDITPFTELSPQNLANAVWSALLVDYTDAGTMGKALGDAGGSGNPWSTPISGNTDPGSFGERVGKKLLDTGTFIALK